MTGRSKSAPGRQYTCQRTAALAPAQSNNYTVRCTGMARECRLPLLTLLEYLSQATNQRAGAFLSLQSLGAKPGLRQLPTSAATTPGRPAHLVCSAAALLPNEAEDASLVYYLERVAQVLLKQEVEAAQQQAEG